MVCPLSGLRRLWPPGSVSQVMHGAALVRAQATFGFSPYWKKVLIAGQEEKSTAFFTQSSRSGKKQHNWFNFTLNKTVFPKRPFSIFTLSADLLRLAQIF